MTESFAVLDDSLEYSDGIYVYTHALIVEDGLPQVLEFTGDKREIYQHEKEIFNFVAERLPEGCSLYACNHYLCLYNSMWKIVHNRSMADKMPRNVKKQFDKAHHAAKDTAKKKLEDLLDAEKPKKTSKHLYSETP